MGNRVEPVSLMVMMTMMMHFPLSEVCRYKFSGRQICVSILQKKLFLPSLGSELWCIYVYTSLQEVTSGNAFVFTRSKSNIESVISLSKWASLR